MPCSAITASSMPRRPSRPPWTSGCRILTRPSMISETVSALTSVICRRASQHAGGAAGGNRRMPSASATGEIGQAGLVGDAQRGTARVDERGVEHRALRNRRRAVGTGCRTRSATAGRVGGSSVQAVMLQLLAQGRAIGAERGRRALVAAVPGHACAAAAANFGDPACRPSPGCESTSGDSAGPRARRIRAAPVAATDPARHRHADGQRHSRRTRSPMADGGWLGTGPWRRLGSRTGGNESTPHGPAS